MVLSLPAWGFAFWMLKLEASASCEVQAHRVCEAATSKCNWRQRPLEIHANQIQLRLFAVSSDEHPKTNERNLLQSAHSYFATCPARPLHPRLARLWRRPRGRPPSLPLGTRHGSCSPRAATLIAPKRELPLCHHCASTQKTLVRQVLHAKPCQDVPGDS